MSCTNCNCANGSCSKTRTKLPKRILCPSCNKELIPLITTPISREFWCDDCGMEINLKREVRG